MMDAWAAYALSVAAKITVVLACALLAARLMRRRPAAERHLVWVVAAAGVLAVPLLAAVTPSLPIPVASRVSAWFAADEPVVVRAAPTAPAAGVADEARTSVAPMPTVSARSIVATQTAAPSRSMSAPLLLFVLWLAGVLVTAARLGLEFARVHVLSRRARPLTDAALCVRARGIAAELGVLRPVRLLEGEAGVMPMTFGVLRASLLLPSSARMWPAARQEAVLRHELAHIRRYDSVTQLIGELGCVLYWFQPLMWWAARSLRVEREHACDDAVLAAGSRASDYAADLLDIARITQPARVTALAAIAMARPSQLRARLAALLDERPRRARVSGRLLVPAWAGAFLVIVPLSSLDPASEPGLIVQRGWMTTAPRIAAPPVTEHPLTANPAEPAPTAAVQSAPDPLHAGLVFNGPAPRAGTSQEDCLTGRLNNVNSNTNNGRRVIRWSGANCSGEVIIEGDVEFDADFTRITGLSRDGYLRITTQQGRDERRLVMEPGASGVTYDYTVNGDRRTFDAAGEQWLSGQLLLLFRRMSFMASERATAILERGGANALLTEIGLLQGDHVRAAYLEVLIARGQLDEASLRRVLTLAGNTVQSDHYRTQIVTAVAGRYTLTDGVRDAYIDAVSHMDSDHYRHAAFSTLLERGRLSPAQVNAVLRETGRIDSDHYRATLLMEIKPMYRSVPEIRGAFHDAAADIDSDHYKTQVLTGLLELGGLSAADRARVVDAAATIDSDHYRAQVLTQVAADGLRDATLQRSFVRAAAGIDSDHYLQTVLSSVVRQNNLQGGALLAVLEAAASVESDHNLSVLLVDIAGRHQLTGDARERFVRLMDGIESKHYHGLVASALLRQAR